MDIAVYRRHEDIGDKVILHPRVDLHDVASLSTHIEVVEGGTFKLLRAFPNGKGMRSGEMGIIIQVE